MISDCTCGWIHTRQTGEPFKEPMRVQYDRDCPLHGVIDEEYVTTREELERAARAGATVDEFHRMWLNKPTHGEDQEQP